MRNKDYLVIDIGKSNIKMLEASYQQPKVVIKNYSMIPTPEKTYENGNILNPDVLVKVIGDELRNSKFISKRTALLVSSDAIITREVLLPRAGEKELQNIVHFEANQYFPIDLQKFKIDFKVIEEVKTNEGDKTKIFVVAVPKTVIEDTVNLSVKLGLDVRLVDIHPNALSKVAELELKNNTASNNKSYVILSLGTSASRMIIVRDGKLMFERIIKVGLGEMISKIKKQLDLKYPQAEKKFIDSFRDYINHANIDNEEVKAVGSNIRGLFMNLIDQVNSMIEFYTSRNQDTKVEDIILTGGGALLEGVDAFIAQVTGMNVRRFNISSIILDQSQKKLSGTDVFFSSAIGSIVRNIK